ncbi:MAG TPA: hypothetical protein VFJ71_07650 [Candidatus Limnocylindrales bacterium]|nr:hypothetical protein [Candidatus Limnocylindrales bacterium]
MASRADAVPIGAPAASRAAPTAPSLGGAVRAALGDFFYHSWRLLPANVVWAVVAMALAAAAVVVPIAIVLVPLLAIPTAGVFRVTTRIVRGSSVSFWDAVDAWRSDVARTLAVGTGVVLALLVLGTNLVIGLGGDSPLGWAIATMAAWGLAVLWLVAWTAWPILEDPERARTPLRLRLRLAALLVLAHPIRIGLLGVGLAAFLVLSTVAIVALVTVSVSFGALVTTRYVLPAADRLEAQLDGVAPPDRT